jgi:two-component system nitrate/nitrite sensor histidine kinase NarX
VRLVPVTEGSGTDRRPPPGVGVSPEIAASLEPGGPLGPLLARGMGAIVALTGAKGGAIRLVLRNDGRMHLICSSGLPEELLDDEQDVETGCGSCGEALRHDALQVKTLPAACVKRMGPALTAADVGVMLAVPLHCRGLPIGVFNLFFDQNTPLPADMSAILTPVTELLDLVLESAEHEHDRLQASLVAERQALANEVHDALAQNLSFMRMRMSLLQDAIRERDADRAQKYFSDVNETLGETHAGLRSLITHFRQSMDPLGFVHALENTARTFQNRTGIALHVQNRMPNLHLPAEHESQVLHIIQEALANVVKHAEARNASVTIERRNDCCRISVADDGRGSSARGRRAAHEDGHYGLAIMRERAERIGARLAIHSAAGRGTRVRLDIPLPIAPAP